MRQLDRLFARVDDRIRELIEQGARERLYFLRLPVPRIDDCGPELVKPMRARSISLTAPVQTDLITTARTRLRPEPNSLRPAEPYKPGPVRLRAAIVHQPERRGAPNL